MLDNQAKHLNGVPPKTQIVHGIYSSISTFLRTHGPGNIQSPRTEKGTSQPQHNMPCDNVLLRTTFSFNIMSTQSQI